MKTVFIRKALPLLTAIILAGCADDHDTPASETKVDDIHTAHDHDDAKVSPEEKSANTVPTVRTAKAHSHGDAKLAVVLDKGTVTIELDSPLYNIVGFEHAPETPAQKAVVKEAESQLSRSAQMFNVDRAAACQPTAEGRTVTLFDTHADHHDEDDHDADAKQKSGHQDVVLQYTFLCQSPSKLSYVDVNLFEFFETLTEIDVTYLGPSVQKQVTLTSTNSQLDITR